jgi:large subunit ribosomal protein L47
MGWMLTIYLLQVRRTQRAIKQVLTERYYSWRDAEVIAQKDPEVDLSGTGPVFTPSEFVEEEISETEGEQAQLIPDTKPEQRTNPSV